MRASVHLMALVWTCGLFAWAGGRAATAAEGRAAPPPLYAFCVEEGVPGVKPRSIAEQAKLLRDLGFDGAAYPLWLDGQLGGNLQILDQAGLQLSMVFTRVNLKDVTRPYDPRVREALSQLKGRNSTVCVLLGGFKPGDPQGMAPAVRILRELGDLAASCGLRISIYHHVGDWTESLPFALEVAQHTDHPDVGVNFNLCHWLKVEGDKDYRPLLRENASKIFAVTINGAKAGADTWTDGLIQPLDQGDFDNRPLLATLREAGYHGPIGLMCFGVPGDPREHLAHSMKAWQRLNQSLPGPR